MRPNTALVIYVLVTFAGVQCLRILQSNDDGWAELYIRSLNDALLAAGHQVLLSAPAHDRSGTGNREREPWPLLVPGQYNSCPGNEQEFGRDQTRPDLYWVNSYPVTAARYGIELFAPSLWGARRRPDLVVAGPNVGSNLEHLHVSGTVAIAAYASSEGIPGIAFSGGSGGRLPWYTSPVPVRSEVYAALAARLIDRITSGRKPYLPRDTLLNVNFPKVSEGHCSNPYDFKWVLSRVTSQSAAHPDVKTCGSERLPDERRVVTTPGCYISVTVVNSKDLRTASKKEQKFVLDKLGNLLSCLPQ
ncbi:survival protein sure-like phosphatase/nucleotidase [Colletotrichum cereale]|nr:survival protein sure-like phosphatase/nucleotidase [Colletotrichum cereale]